MGNEFRVVDQAASDEDAELTIQTAPAQSPRSADIVTTIGAAMREMGVAGLPRNYEIFYEAFTGSNEELRTAFFALGNRSTQDQLDILARKYFAQTNGLGIVESAREQIERKLDEIKALLQRERTSLEKYGMILDQTSGGLANRQTISKDFLEKILSITTAATESTRDHGRQIASSISDKSAELESVKTKLEEYKRLADTDPLTQLTNRRGFDSELARIYNSKKSVMFAALILVDIDKFKEINDKFGHPVGDRILQLVARLLEANVTGAISVCRTGGEEFAIVIEGLSEDSVLQLAEALRNAIANTEFAHRESGTNYGRVTISLGVCMAAEATSPDDLYIKADRALYASKSGGRNRVTRFAALARSRKNWMLYRNE